MRIVITTLITNVMKYDLCQLCQLTRRLCS